MKKHLYAILIAAALATGLAATKFVSQAPAPAIRGVLEQVADTRDLCNGYLLDGCPVAIDDQRLVDQQDWLVSETGATSVTYATMRNDCVVAGAACLAFQPTSVIFHKGDLSYTTDVRGVVISSAATRIALLQKFGAKQSEIVLKWYPGYEARHPSSGNPIGEPWPDHPYAKNGWKMYRASPADNDTTFPVGGVFQSDQRKWRKWKTQIKPGAGPFGMGGEVANAWEEVTLR